MITLYDYELSGNCYKLRLFMSILGIAYTAVPIDFYPGREHRSTSFLRINPLGQLPVIDDDGFVLRDAQAITATASAARLHDSFLYDLDIEAARAGAHRLFRIMDEHLWFGEQQGRDWLCAAAQPTIADIACFPYVMLSEQGGISRQDYPAIRRWCDRVKRIEGFVVMPGIFPAGRGRS